MFGNIPNGDVPKFNNDAEKWEWSYNKILDGACNALDSWAGVSMAAKDGSMTAEQAIDKYDQFMVQFGFPIMLLDEIRKAEARKNAEAEVAKFREQLDKAPTVDEPKYDL